MNLFQINNWMLGYRSSPALEGAQGETRRVTKIEPGGAQIVNDQGRMSLCRRLSHVVSWKSVKQWPAEASPA